MWDELVRGAIGGVVLVDTRRLDDCFPAVDYFESRDLPFIVAVNCFDGVVEHKIDDVREALDVPGDVPIVLCDARNRQSVKLVAARDDPARDHPGCGRSLARRSLSPQDLLEHGDPLRGPARAAFDAVSAAGEPGERGVAEPSQRLGLPVGGPVLTHGRCVTRCRRP